MRPRFKPKAVVALVLILGLALSFSLPIFANAVEVNQTATSTGTTSKLPIADFTKYTDVRGHWAEAYLKWACDRGLLNGVSNTRIDPNGNMTRAQMAAIITRAFGVTEVADLANFIDVPTDAWYRDYIGRAIHMDCLNTTGNAVKPNEPVTREEVATAIVKAAGFVSGDSSALKRFTDSLEISDYARNYIAVAVDNELINGKPGGGFDPKAKVTRGEFAAMMYRLAPEYMTSTVTTSSNQTVEGSLLLGVPNISLDNMEIKGNLFISDPCSSGNVTLNGTTVTGTIYVRGLGAGGLKIQGGSRVGGVATTPTSGTVEVNVEEASTVGSVNVCGTGNVTLTGDVGDVYVRSGKSPVRLIDAEVGSLYVYSKLANVTADEPTKISKLDITSDATGAVVEAGGTVGTLSISASDVTASVHKDLTYLDCDSGVENLKLTLPTEGSISEVTISYDDADVTFSSEIKRLTLSGDDGKFKFSSGAIVNILNVTGDDISLTVDNGAKIATATFEGDNITCEGEGEVIKIDVESGKGARISTKNTTIYNNKGSDVKSGDTTIDRGDTFTTTKTEDNKTTSGITTESDKVATLQTKATPTKYDYTIEIENEGGCTVSPGDTVYAFEGESQDFSFKVDSNYKLLEILIDGVSIGTPKSYTFTNIQENHTIKIVTESNDLKTPVARLEYDIVNSIDSTDYSPTGEYQLKDFGTDLKLASDGTLTGTINTIYDFYWYRGASYQKHATNYYVPIVLKNSNRIVTGTLRIGDGIEFHEEVRSKGTWQYGNWIAYVPLDPASQTKTIKIELDPNGESGTGDEASFTLTYSDVKFTNDNPEIYKGITAALGLNGATPCTLTYTDYDGASVVEAASKTTTVFLKHENLLETKNAAGRFGNWAGIRIPAPAEATMAIVSVTHPDGRAGSESLSIKSGSDGSPYVEWYTDIGAYKAEVKSQPVKLRVSWYSNGALIADVSGETINVRLDQVKPAGGFVTKTPVVENIKIGQVAASELIGYSIEDLISGYRVIAHAAGGTFYPVRQNTGELAVGSYYLPLKVTAKTNIITNIKLDDKILGTLTPLVGEAAVNGVSSAVIYVPLTKHQISAYDVDLSFEVQSGTSSYYSTVVYSLDLSQTVLKAGIIRPTTLDTADSIEELDLAVEAIATDVTRSLTTGTLIVGGTAKKNTSNFGQFVGEWWGVPVRLSIPGEFGNQKVIVKTATAPGVDFSWHVIESGGSYYVDVVVPVVLGKQRVTDAQIQLVDATGAIRDSVSINFIGSTEGF